VPGDLDFIARVGLDRLLTDGILGGNIQELPRHAWSLAVKHVDKSLAGHAIDEGVDDINIGDVGELIVLLGEALNVLPEGLVSPLPIIVEIPGVPWAGVGALKLADEDRAEIAPTTDATRLELLKPSFG
jgi:hypothetical protein